MLSGIYQPEEVRFNVRKMILDRGGVFLRDSVVAVRPGERLLDLYSGGSLAYDVVSFNTGSVVPVTWDGEGRIKAVKPINNLLQARREALELLRDGKPGFVVVGGGPAGVELAGNLARLAEDSPGRASITLVAGSILLKGVPDRARKMVRRNLLSRGVDILEGVRLESAEEGVLVLSDGRSLPADLALAATGVKPWPVFGESGMTVGPDGGLLVNRRLQSVEYPEIFGGGDGVTLEDHQLARVGVYAVRQSPILAHNLLAALEGRRLRECTPRGVFLQILNLGDGRGVGWRKGLVMNGRLAFRLKNYIDRRFMKKFQVSGELLEGNAGEEGLNGGSKK